MTTADWIVLGIFWAFLGALLVVCAVAAFRYRPGCDPIDQLDETIEWFKEQMR